MNAPTQLTAFRPLDQLRSAASARRKDRHHRFEALLLRSHVCQRERSRVG